MSWPKIMALDSLFLTCTAIGMAFFGVTSRIWIPVFIAGFAFVTVGLIWILVEVYVVGVNQPLIEGWHSVMNEICGTGVSSLTLNDYQAGTRRTAGRFDTPEEALVCWSLGIAGESGEFVDAVKKKVYHGHDVPATKLRDELGDVLWYIARAADTLGYSLEEIASANLEKLRARYPDGFSKERSANRKD